MKAILAIAPTPRGVRAPTRTRLTSSIVAPPPDSPTRAPLDPIGRGWRASSSQMAPAPPATRPQSLGALQIAAVKPKRAAIKPEEAASAMLVGACCCCCLGASWRSPPLATFYDRHWRRRRLRGCVLAPPDFQEQARGRAAPNRRREGVGAFAQLNRVGNNKLSSAKSERRRPRSHPPARPCAAVASLGAFYLFSFPSGAGVGGRGGGAGHLPLQGRRRRPRPRATRGRWRAGRANNIALLVAPSPSPAPVSAGRETLAPISSGLGGDALGPRSWSKWRRRRAPAGSSLSRFFVARQRRQAVAVAAAPSDFRERRERAHASIKLKCARHEGAEGAAGRLLERALSSDKNNANKTALAIAGWARNFQPARRANPGQPGWRPLALGRARQTGRLAGRAASQPGGWEFQSSEFICA